MGTQRTYNAYGEDVATIENALAAAETHEDTETVGEALAVLARSYTGWDAGEAVAGEEPHGDGPDDGAEGPKEETPHTSATDGGRPVGRSSQGIRPEGSTYRCGHCGATVTEAYVRVFAPEEGATKVRACPACPDRVRTVDGVREARGTRHNSVGGSVDHSRSEGTRTG